VAQFSIVFAEVVVSRLYSEGNGLRRL